MADDQFLLAVSQQRQLEGNITSRTYGSSQAPRGGGAQRGCGSERTGTASATRMPSLQMPCVVAHEKRNTRRLGISHQLSQTKEMAVSDHQLPSCTGMSPQAGGLTLSHHAEETPASCCPRQGLGMPRALLAPSLVPVEVKFSVPAKENIMLF